MGPAQAQGHGNAWRAGAEYIGSERKRGSTHFSNKERHSLRRLSVSAWGQRKLAFLWRDAAAA
jgi:hypothetical protein